mmetsp:Transcript_593/g.992  ORF Transcript_593/g.992 Transcript_593/m.992 type:complete len:167 (-) Transcript_593:6-506(-)
MASATDLENEMNKGGLVVVCCLLCCLVPLIFGPLVFFIVAGAISLDDECLDDDSDGEQPAVNLALWTLISGAVPLAGMFILGCLNALKKVKVLVVAQLLFSIFPTAWTIYGILILIKSEDCHDENPFLYNSALASIILTLIGVVINLLKALHACCKGDNDDYERIE